MWIEVIESMLEGSIQGASPRSRLPALPARLLGQLEAHQASQLLHGALPLAVELLVQSHVFPDAAQEAQVGGGLEMKLVLGSAQLLAGDLQGSKVRPSVNTSATRTGLPRKTNRTKETHTYMRVLQNHWSKMKLKCLFWSKNLEIVFIIPVFPEFSHRCTLLSGLCSEIGDTDRCTALNAPGSHVQVWLRSAAPLTAQSPLSLLECLECPG